MPEWEMGVVTAGLLVASACGGAPATRKQVSGPAPNTLPSVAGLRGGVVATQQVVGLDANGLDRRHPGWGREGRPWCSHRRRGPAVRPNLALRMSVISTDGLTWRRSS
jgi:hypothetical protein